MAKYQSFNVLRRCPEPFGYSGWQTRLNNAANPYRKAGYSTAEALDKAWINIQKEMDAEAKIGREYDRAYQTTHLNQLCQSWVGGKLGSGWTAKYKDGSGNVCIATKK